MAVFTFIAETSSGSIIQESAVSAPTHKEAYAAFWLGLTDAERDACACIECLDEVTV